MIAELRIYTINKGEMDAFLAHFQKDVVKLHERVGMPIIATWVNKPQNEFIWMRTFADEADREAKGKAFQAERAAAGVTLGENVAKMEVRVLDPAMVSVPAGA